MAKPYNIQTEQDISKLSPFEFEQIRNYLTGLYFSGTDQISKNELDIIYSQAENLGISKDVVPLLIQKSYEAGGAKGYNIDDINKLMQGATLPQVQQSKAPVTGGKGLDFAGENTGLRDAYVPFAEDMLERLSGLLALRDVSGAYKDMYNYSTPAYEQLKTQRLNTISKQPTFTTPTYSFAAKPPGGATGGRVHSEGIMSLMNAPDKYQEGGSVATQPAYTPTSFTAGSELGSTFTAPTTTYTAPTSISSGYKEPTNIYKATDISSSYTKPDEYAPTTLASTYSSPTDIYKAGTIASTFTKPASYTGENIASTFTKPTSYTGENIASTFTKPTSYTTANIESTYKTPEEYAASNIATELFGAEQAAKYMSTFMSGVTDPQIREAKRQAELAKQAQAAKFAQAGAFGGSARTIAESELGRNLATQLSDIYGKGQQEAFLNAQQQFERDQSRALEAAKANELARQFGYGQKLSAQKTAAELGLEAAKAKEQSKQFGADIGLRGETAAAELGLEAAKAKEQSKQFGADIGLRGETAAAELALEAQKAKEQSKQFGADIGLRGETAAAELGLEALKASEQAKQIAGQQALSDAQTKAELALEASKAAEQAKQFGYGQKTKAEELAADFGLRANIASEQAKQVAGQQGLTSAETAARLGLDAEKLLEQSRQTAASQALETAQAESDAQARARELQQRAEEARARGDEFAANLAQRQYEEAVRGIESQRTFDYQTARDEYLDPFRELQIMSNVLNTLPAEAGGATDSSTLQALIAAIGAGNLLNPTTGTTTSDRRLKTDIQPIGMLDDGLKVYSYRYKSGGPVQIGVMADEVAVLRPQAYIKGGAGDGFDAVDYSKL